MAQPRVIERIDQILEVVTSLTQVQREWLNAFLSGGDPLKTAQYCSLERAIGMYVKQNPFLLPLIDALERAISGNPPTAVEIEQAQEDFKDTVNEDANVPSTRVVVISDTHCMHRRLDVPDGDLLIHCGDMTNRGSAPELQDVNEWLGTLPHPHKMVIAGNMDQRLEGKPKQIKQQFLSNAVYVEDELVELAGLSIWGSPYTPKFCGGFQLADASEAQAKWAAIPEAIDIVVTHGPPYGALDLVGMAHVGDLSLRERLQKVRPRYHFFGHIHEEGGNRCQVGPTQCINAAQTVMVIDIPNSKALDH